MRYIKYLVYILLLTCLQAFFLQRMWSGFYVSVYITFFILMDVNTPKWLVLITACFCGALIDILSAGAGLNVAVCTALALLRYPFIKILVPNNVIEDGGPILSSSVPMPKFILYVSIMLFLWGVMFFFLESSFLNPYATLVNILFNVVVGTLVITVIQLLVKQETTSKS